MAVGLRTQRPSYAAPLLTRLEADSQVASVPGVRDLVPTSNLPSTTLRNARRPRVRPTTPRRDERQAQTSVVPHGSATAQLDLEGGLKVTPRVVGEPSSRPRRALPSASETAKGPTDASAPKFHPRASATVVGDGSGQVQAEAP